MKSFPKINFSISGLPALIIQQVLLSALALGLFFSVFPNGPSDANRLFTALLALSLFGVLAMFISKWAGRPELAATAAIVMGAGATSGALFVLIIGASAIIHKKTYSDLVLLIFAIFVTSAIGSLGLAFAFWKESIKTYNFSPNGSLAALLVEFGLISAILSSALFALR